MQGQLQMFGATDCQKLTLSPSDHLARILAWLESVKELKGSAAVLCGKQYGSLMSADQTFLSGKMLKECSAQTMAQTFGQLSKPLPTLGVIDLNGNCLIRHGFYPKTGRESTLSDVLEGEVEERYFLSQKALTTLHKHDNNPSMGYRSTVLTQTTQKARTESEQ